MAEEKSEKKISLVQHLVELRKRFMRVLYVLIVIFSVTYHFGPQLIEFAIAPLMKVMPEGSTLSMLKLTEGFFTELKISIYASLFFAMPYILYELWKFISPGLYANERRYVFGFVFFATLLFVSGAAFAYYVAFPFGFEFFLSYVDENITANLSLEWYFSFVSKMTLGFGLIFEMPIVTLFLAKMGLVTAKMMRKYRRYSIIGIFIVAAILTPPDVFSQVLMAAPMLILYEISVIVAMIFGKKKVEVRDDIYE